MKAFTPEVGIKHSMSVCGVAHNTKIFGKICCNSRTTAVKHYVDTTVIGGSTGLGKTTLCPMYYKPGAAGKVR